MLKVQEAPRGRRRPAGNDAGAHLEVQLVGEIGVDVVTEFDGPLAPAVSSGSLVVDQVVEGTLVQHPGRHRRP